MGFFKKQPPEIEWAYPFEGCVTVNILEWDGDWLRAELTLERVPANYPLPPAYAAAGYKSLHFVFEDASGRKLGDMSAKFTIDGSIRNLEVGMTGKCYSSVASRGVNPREVVRVSLHLSTA